MENGSYSFAVDHENKIITLTFYGNPKDEDVKKFHHDYMEVISPIQTSEYLLLLDGSQMSVPKKERLHQMQVSFALYRKSGFEKISFIILNDDIRRSVLKLIRFSGMETISDIAYITPDEKEAVVKKHIEEVEQKRVVN